MKNFAKGLSLPLNKSYLFAFCLLLSSLRGECQSTLLNGIASYMKLNETSGNAIDEVSANNGTVTGTTQNASGKINAAYSFDGTLDYVTFPDVQAFMMDFEDHSFNAWVYITSYPASGLKYAIIGGELYSAGMFINSAGYLEYGIYNHSQATASSTQVPLNQWVMLTVTKNYFSSTNGTKYYINGNLTNSVTYVIDPNESASSNIIGACISSGNYYRLTTGSIDEVGMWKKILSADEVTELYNSGSGLSYPFNGGTPSIPTVTTTSISGITQNSASSGGNVTSDGGANVTSRGVCWSTTSNPTISNSKTNDGNLTGVFTSSVTGLSAGTTYHVRAYATNSAGTGYGSDLSFTTASAPVAPVVTTSSITNITQTTASSGGNVTSDGGASVTARGVCWNTTGNPTTSSSKTTDGTGAGTFTSSITGLSNGTTYYVRAYATNSVGTTYGNELSFNAGSPTGWQTSGGNVYYNSGNVGIGTATSFDAKLNVNGKILAEEVEVISNIASDFVFDPGYKLMPITELEEYLETNRHLPEIPSAEEFSREGQNLGEMDDLLLRKIEQLTLYLINQDQILNEQTRIIQELMREIDLLKSK